MIPEDPSLTEALRRVIAAIHTQHGDWAEVTIKPPRKKRTTGEKSQNHHLNGHILQICQETGNGYSVVKDYIKQIAVELFGYSYTEIGGKIIPTPESESTTAECAKLIEATHYVAADLGMILREE